MDFNEKPSTYQIAPAGTHTGILYSIIDIGTHPLPPDDQGVVNYKRKVRYTWELSDEMMENGKPFVVSKEFNQSTHEKSTLAITIKAWLGEVIKPGFNPFVHIGKAGNITINHDISGEKTWANIMGVAPLKKSEKIPAMINSQVMFDLDKFDLAVFNSLPDFLQKKIKLSPEYTEAINRMNGAYNQPEPVLSPSQAAAKAAHDLNDDIVF